jgi:hypothetical protein
VKDARTLEAVSSRPLVGIQQCVTDPNALVPGAECAVESLGPHSAHRRCASLPPQRARDPDGGGQPEPPAVPVQDYASIGAEEVLRYACRVEEVVSRGLQLLT